MHRHDFPSVGEHDEGGPCMSDPQTTPLTGRLNDAVYGKLPNMAAAKALLSDALTALLKQQEEIWALQAHVEKVEEERNELARRYTHG